MCATHGRLTGREANQLPIVNYFGQGGIYELQQYHVNSGNRVGRCDIPKLLFTMRAGGADRRRLSIHLKPKRIHF